MKNIWTKVATISASLLGGMALATGALAVEATNSNTGADSNNEAEVAIQNNTTVSSSNTANINNNISISANTGNNSANENTGDGSVSTGDITGSVKVTNTGNMNGVFDSILNLNCSCDFSASNSHTGAYSNNDANITINNDIDISTNNEARADNDVDADLNTGENSADENTGDGWVSTGDIDFSVEITNDLNKNFIGAPLPEEPSGPGVPPATLPPSAPKPGKVLAAAEGLPVTGGNLPNWPLLLIAIGFLTRLTERVLRTRFGEVA
ncbi:MAG: hypothetical protein A2Z24_00545 [Candidatus Woykebacteria bacterium RBG_16_44_10]|uniref:Gram-positive cocci surface proteins LPxTG domain-containing protein n=1 Tax=Candidatus Woykebacteria bacterium RBG_16_44_10 TaxID=1802597 RepID=A0A1G1WDS4_9BACT|nr:MAG: hypothetical protein A2Z24_00545 [Candidatus Woykebacteria bacterium RBG_16_44_10]